MASNDASLLTKFLGLMTSATRPGVGLGVEIAKKIKGRNAQPGQELQFDVNKLNKLGIFGNVLKQNTVSQTNNPFLTESEQRNIPLTTGKALAGAASYAVPFGKATSIPSILTKILTPGAAVGGLQALSDPQVSPGSVARSVTGGATGAGLVAGGSQLLGKVLSAGAKGITQKLPEQLMSGVFKEPLKDTRSALKGGKTLGQEALKRGIKGSSDEAIYTDSIRKINKYEDQLQAALSESKRIVPIADIKKAVQPLITKYSKAGNTSAVSNISDRVAALEKYNGKSVPVSVANEIKRTLYDEARGGYGKLASENIEGVKAIAKALKEGIGSKVKGANALNKELSVEGRIADSLIDKMARSGRNNLLGLTDTIMTTGGYAAAGPAGLLPVAAKNILGSTAGKTYLANILKAGQPMGEGISKNAQVVSNPIIQQIIGQASSRIGGSLPGVSSSPQTNANQNNQENNEPQSAPPVLDQSNTDILSQLTSQGVSPEIAQQFATRLTESQTQASGIPSGVKITPEMAAMAQIMLDPKDAAKIKAAYEIQQSAAEKGTKQKPLTEAQAAKADVVKLTDKAISQLEKAKTGPISPKLEELKANVNAGDQSTLEFNNTIAQIKATLAKARAGTSFTPNEEKLLNKYTPNIGDSKQQLQTKLSGLRSLFENKTEATVTDDQSMQILQQLGVLPSQ